MNVPFVDLKAQYLSIRREIDQAMETVLSETSFIGGAHVKAFEENFAKFIGTKHCVGCANGTDSLQIGMKALGIGIGDEVIVPANSFIATSEAVTNTGARPVFADADENRFTLDVNDINKKITSKTKAVIVVHLYGMPAEMDEIMALAKKHGLFVIEDAAQAHGALYKGRKVGTMGDIASFSFYPGKNLGAYGDAGAITTNDPSIANFCKKFANHGRISKYDHDMEGVNSRLDGLQAAILNVKLGFLNDWTEKRIQNAGYYKRHLDPKKYGYTIVPETYKHVYHLFVVRVPARERILQELAVGGISAGVHYPISLPMLKAYAGFGHKHADFPVSNSMTEQLLSLPMYPELTTAQMDHVIHCLEKANS